eukprot:Gb_17614 [translate_table: standard]
MRASCGIGAQIALELGRNGAKVVINYIGNAEKEEEVASALNSAHPLTAITVRADISNSSEVSKLFDKAQECFGHIHNLVNNAGVIDSTCPSIANTTLQV